MLELTFTSLSGPGKSPITCYANLPKGNQRKYAIAFCPATSEETTSRQETRLRDQQTLLNFYGSPSSAPYTSYTLAYLTYVCHT